MLYLVRSELVIPALTYHAVQAPPSRRQPAPLRMPWRPGAGGPSGATLPGQDLLLLHPMAARENLSLPVPQHLCGPLLVPPTLNFRLPIRSCLLHAGEEWLFQALPHLCSRTMCWYLAGLGYSPLSFWAVLLFLVVGSLLSGLEHRVQGPARRRRGKVFSSPEWQRPPHWEGVFPTACTQGAGALPCRGFAPAGGLRFRGPSDSGYLVHVWAPNTHKHGHTYSHIYTNPHTHMHLHVLTHVLPKIYTQRPPHTHTRTCSTLGSWIRPPEDVRVWILGPVKASL